MIYINFQIAKMRFRIFSGRPGPTVRLGGGAVELHPVRHIFKQESRSIQRVGEEAAGGQRMRI